MDLGPHAIFIWLCYGTVALVVSGLIAWLWLDGRRRERELLDLEQRGLGRGARVRRDAPGESS